VVHCRDPTASFSDAKVRGEVFSHFHAVAVKRRSSIGIDRLACQEEFFANDPSYAKENNEHAFDFALHMSRFFLYSSV
jgi:hypothetical protein